MKSKRRTMEIRKARMLKQERNFYFGNYMVERDGLFNLGIRKEFIITA